MLALPHTVEALAGLAVWVIALAVAFIVGGRAERVAAAGLGVDLLASLVQGQGGLQGARWLTLTGDVSPRSSWWVWPMDRGGAGP